MQMIRTFFPLNDQLFCNTTVKRQKKIFSNATASLLLLVCILGELILEEALSGRRKSNGQTDVND